MWSFSLSGMLVKFLTGLFSSHQQRVGHASLHGPEQPHTVPDDLRQGNGSKAVRQTQQTERPDGDERGAAKDQTQRGVEQLDHWIQVRVLRSLEEGGDVF